MTDVDGNMKMVQELFCSSSVFYAQYKAHLASLRLFVFTGVTAFCLLALIARPPRSLYWLRFSPFYAFYGTTEAFSPSSKPVFLITKATTSTDAFAVAKEEAFKR